MEIGMQRNDLRRNDDNNISFESTSRTQTKMDFPSFGFVLCEHRRHGKCITKLKSPNTRSAFFQFDCSAMERTRWRYNVNGTSLFCIELTKNGIALTPSGLRPLLHRMWNGRKKSDIEQFIDYSKSI